MNMFFRGYWDSSTEYNPGDCVVHQGQLYILNPNYGTTDTGTPPDQGRNMNMYIPLSQGAY